MSPEFRGDKPIVWLHGEIKSPPFSMSTRVEAGILLRALQKGESVSLPHSRPLPSLGKNCHELRIADENKIWRIIYRIDYDAIILLEIFAKKTNKLPQKIISNCKTRMKRYDHESK